MEIESSLLDKLMKENDEFKKRYKEHSELKQKVEELNQRKFLTPQEELEKKNIQNQKLKNKDRIDEILNEYHARAS